MKAVPSLLIIVGFIYYMLVNNGYIVGPRTMWRNWRKNRAIVEVVAPSEPPSATLVSDYIPDGEWDASEILGVSREDVVHVPVGPPVLGGASPEERKEWLAHRLAKNEFKTKTGLVGVAAQEFDVTERTIWLDLKGMNNEE